MHRGNIKLVDDRDAVVNYLSFKIGDIWYSISHSIEHPDYSHMKGIIRAQVEYFISEYAPGEAAKGCKLSRFARIDPMGSIPDFVKDIVTKRAGMDMLDMRKAMLE